MLDRPPRRRPGGPARILAQAVAQPDPRVHTSAWPCLRHAPPVLAVGALGVAPRSMVDPATGAQAVLVPFDRLDEALLTRHQPSVVFSPVLTRDFDALDLARRLVELGFRGRYVGVAEALPRPALVRAELMRACPSLDVAVVVLGSAERPTVRVI